MSEIEWNWSHLQPGIGHCLVTHTGVQQRLFLSVLLVDKVFKSGEELSPDPPQSVIEFLHSRWLLRFLQRAPLASQRKNPLSLQVMQDHVDVCYGTCRFFLATGGPGMLVAVMCGMLLPFAVLHYLDYISLTWRVGKSLRVKIIDIFWRCHWECSKAGHRERSCFLRSCEGFYTMMCPPGLQSCASAFILPKTNEFIHVQSNPKASEGIALHWRCSFREECANTETSCKVCARIDIKQGAEIMAMTKDRMSQFKNQHWLTGAGGRFGFHDQSHQICERTSKISCRMVIWESWKSYPIYKI